MTTFFSQGFRPFFLFAALWAGLAMALWIAYWAGVPVLTGAMLPLDWHVHELIFGYGGAVLCGFLLTAIPNWTNRPPVSGLPLARLALVWLVARVGFLLPDEMIAPSLLAALALLFPVLFCLIAGRELVAAKNRRNLPVLAICVAFLAADAVFLWQALRDGVASGGAAERAGIAVLIVLISLIGGRIVPAFTRNWLIAKGVAGTPAEFAALDKVVLAGSVGALLSWVLWPDAIVTGALLLVLAPAHALRLSRWRGLATRSELLLFGLHLGYGFVALGFLLTGAGALLPDLVPAVAGIHAWTVGAVGLMTLTVMTRASLGHSGRPLVAGPTERGFISAILLAAVLRILSTWGALPETLLYGSAGLWCLAFGLFALRFLPVMIAPRS
jgi:uncharacterized protein involved in response to NO